MRKYFKPLLAVCIGILPVNLIMIWYRLTYAESFTITDMLLYPLIIGGGNILLILALNRYLLKEKLGEFNPGKGSWYLDFTAAFVLTAVYFLLMFIERSLLSGILPQGKPQSQEVIELMTGLAQNPVLLAIWLGPVAWIGVALFEEISRVFFMNCLWKLGNHLVWSVVVIIIVAVFAGIVHFYQGPIGIISVGIQGLVAGLFYFKFRRIWPLIISHALFDSIQILMFVFMTT